MRNTVLQVVARIGLCSIQQQLCQTCRKYSRFRSSRTQIPLGKKFVICFLTSEMHLQQPNGSKSQPQLQDQRRFSIHSNKIAVQVDFYHIPNPKRNTSYRDAIMLCSILAASIYWNFLELTLCVQPYNLDVPLRFENYSDLWLYWLMLNGHWTVSMDKQFHG